MRIKYQKKIAPIQATCRTIIILLILIVSLISCDLFAQTNAKNKKTQKKATTKKKVVRAQLSPTPIQLARGELPLAAEGAALIDAFTGEVIYQKNSDQTYFPASATKVLTALLIIEEGNLDQEITIELSDTKVAPSALDLKPGEKFTRRQMLYGLMLKSANDVAQALARDNAGSVEAFGMKMTKRAQDLGALSSSFINPHGLHHKNHYTTPHDLALISKAAMEQPFFRHIVSTIDYSWITPTGITQLKNKNRLLWQFPGCTGIKTGYTVPAQQVLVSSAMRNGREVISVVLHTNRPGIWEDSKLLLDYGFSHLPTLGFQN